ncbi:MAG: type II secretion system protein GspF [Gammaproteobacteria bacterium]|nr:type II secretion system protein GspF [Gammaproteobacteria bacterium]NBP08134.1 type II secretion system protein GspF [Gammaproteobacteria bacterium]NCW56878.1 type II secretion system protein GspF [Gammaproteobacteria bacterium]NDB16104.1 type II secretion system protein GspF [Gammaproteobacteria bacterium]NDB25759.1 type II secretion system protein GspF [Gammaproteobacteria bacterium]
MAAYDYVALDAAGREQRGVLEGDSPRQIRQLLRERQLLPISVEALRETPQNRDGESWLQRLPRRGARIGSAEVALLTRQLATLVRAALPLEESLLAVSQQSEKPAVQRVVAAVRARVVEGEPLAHALGGFPRVFPEIYRATVAAGEQSGRLDTVLERLAEYTENRDQLRQRVLGALLYPIVLTVMCLLIITGLLTYVVPKVVEVFESGKTALPLLTRMLLATSNFLQDFGLWLLLLIVLGIVGFSRWVRAPEARRKVDALLLRLPLIGRLVRGFNTARFTRTFSILTGSAVPVLEALHIAGRVINNLPMRDAVTTATERVREGAPIGRSLAASRLFPPMTVHLISSGESSGRLEEMLERAAANQERELDGLLTALVGLLGPLLIVGMGIFVLVIVFAMLMPIFEMNTLVR